MMVSSPAAPLTEEKGAGVPVLTRSRVRTHPGARTVGTRMKVTAGGIYELRVRNHSIDVEAETAPAGDVVKAALGAVTATGAEEPEFRDNRRIRVVVAISRKV